MPVKLVMCVLCMVCGVSGGHLVGWQWWVFVSGSGLVRQVTALRCGEVDGPKGKA